MRGDLVLGDAVEDGVLVELVELRLQEGDGEGAGERRHTLSKRRPVSANHRRHVTRATGASNLQPGCCALSPVHLRVYVYGKVKLARCGE